MSEVRGFRRARRGTALISALFLVLATTVLVTGGAAFVLAHNDRVRNEEDYAGALQLAEAGINYELWNISKNGLAAADPATNPHTGSIPGVTGSYSVSIQNASGGTWTTGAMYVVSKGTVGQLSRAVSVVGKTGTTAGSGGNLWGPYTIFGTKSVSISNDLYLTGSVGSNGPITITSGSSFKVSGTIDKCGSSSSLTYPSWYVWDTYLNDLMTKRVRTMPYQSYPSVDTLVASAFSSGWDYLKSDTALNRSNGKIKLWKDYPSSLTATPDAMWPATSTTVTWNKNGKIITTGYVNAIRLTDNYLKPLGDPWGIATALGSGRTMLFPPGDYYFEQISLSGNTKIIIDNASGPVRIWLDNPADGTNPTDQMVGSVTFTFTDPSTAAQKFRMFSNQHGTFLLNGAAACGGFYFVNSSEDAAVQFGSGGGSFTVTGGVVANVISSSGPLTISAPSGPMGDPTSDPGSGSTYYAFGSQWQEKPISTGGVVFSDGTSN